MFTKGDNIMASKLTGIHYGDGSNLTGVAKSANFTGQFKYLGTGVSYDLDRSMKVNGGIAVYSAYSTGSNRPTTYDTALQVSASGRGFEIVADWVSPTDTPLYVRSLRDCCQNWSTFSRIYTDGYHPSADYADNADKLDGKHASEFATSSHNHDDRYFTEAEADSRFVNTTGDTMTGQLHINNTADAQLQLQSPSSWTGIGFNDSASTGAQYIWHYGGTGTWAIGGGGSAVNGKKLHIDGGTSIGVDFDNESVPANGLAVQGVINTTQINNTRMLEGSFTVGGDANTYYPVYWYGGDQTQIMDIEIYRGYNETAPSTWHTATHKGGLNFRLSVNFGGWGGAAYDSLVTDFRQTYSNMVSEIGWFANNRGFCIWLRGGGAIYRYKIKGPRNNAPTVALSAVDPGGNNTGVAPRSDAPQTRLFRDFVVTRHNGQFTNSISVSGSITATGDVTAYSDDSLKTNVQVIDNALDRVDSLRGVTFDRVEDGSTSTGVIAQELQQVLPEAVHADSNGSLHVAYGNITGLLIEAVKELKADNEELRNMIKGDK